MKHILLNTLIFLSFINSFSQDTIKLYLDENYKKINKEKASIYRQAIVKNNHYYISDKLMNGQMINYGEYSSLNPWIEDGLCLYYNDDGSLYSSGKYLNGKITGKWIYILDDNIDTIDYKYVEKYFNMSNDSCDNYLQSLSKVDSSDVTTNIKEDILQFLNKNLHIPARCKDLDTNYRINIEIVIDTAGFVKCPVIMDSTNLDLIYEACRVLFLYKNYNSLKIPLRMTIPVGFKKTKISHEEGVWFVETNASFQAGDLNSFSTWIYSHITFPMEAIKDNITGKVILQFSVDSNGKVCDVKVTRSLNPYLDIEATRVVLNSPMWTPAKQRRKSVKQNFVIPILFK